MFVQGLEKFKEITEQVLEEFARRAVRLVARYLNSLIGRPEDLIGYLDPICAGGLA